MRPRWSDRPERDEAASRDAPTPDASTIAVASPRRLASAIGNQAFARHVAAAPATASDEDARERSASDPYEQWKRRKETPYGVFVYWETTAGEVLPVLARALEDNRRARSLFTALQEQIGAQEAAEARIDEFTQPPSDFRRDIAEHATADAVAHAETAEGSKNVLLTLIVLLKDLKARLQDANAEVRLSNRALSAAAKREQAAGLRARGERQEAQIDAALTLVGAAIEGTVGVLTSGPTAAIKPAYDAITAVIRLFDENDLVAEAEALEREARAMELADAAERLNRARSHLEHVSDMLGEAQSVSRDVEADYARQRARAEAEFDRTSRGRFRFGDVVEGIELADRTYELAHDALREAIDAESSAHQVRWTWEESYQPDRDRAARMSWAMWQDAHRWREQSLEARTEADDLRDMLREMRVDAGEALVTAPGTGVARAR